MSSRDQSELRDAIGRAIQRWQDANETFDEAVGQRHGLGSAERRCLSFVSQGPQTASAIAHETALTPAAVTSLIDRLEARGMVRRGRDANDRRKIFVEATDRASEFIADAYLPVAQAGAELLERYSSEELRTILRFLEESIELRKRMTESLVSRAGARADG